MNSETTGTTAGAQGTQPEEAKRKAEESKQKATAEAKEGGRVVAEEAKAVGQQAGELGREHAERRFEQGKERVEGQVDAMSGALDDAAQRLRAENNPLASYADELSGQLSQLSQGIENSTLDDVAVKTRRLARENPGLFVLGSMVAGLAAARFFKASAEREHRERHDSDDYGYGSDDGYGGRDSGARGGYRDDYGRRDEYRRDSYRDEGYAASAARDGYRSPVSRTSTSSRTDAGGVIGTDDPIGGQAASGTTSSGRVDTTPTSSGSVPPAMPSVSRVPMDSDVSGTGTGTSSGAIDPTTNKTKTGA